MQRLQQNDSAVPFIMNDYLGNEISLADFKGEKVLLSFFRGASCPFCNMRLQSLIKLQPEFEKKGIIVITLFASSIADIVKYSGKQNAPFAVIPDPELSLYKAYNIEQSISGMFKAMIKPIKVMKMMVSGYFSLKSLKETPVIPADFLIDENQTIFKAYYGKDFGDHISIEDILNWKS